MLFANRAPLSILPVQLSAKLSLFLSQWNKDNSQSRDRLGSRLPHSGVSETGQRDVKETVYRDSGSRGLAIRLRQARVQ